MNIMDKCWNNASLQSWSNPTGWAANCSANPYCANTTWGCEPECSSQTTSAACVAGNLSGNCKWMTGWCSSATAGAMFDNMEAGAPTPLGMDNCMEGIQASVDICGFGMKDMNDAFGFGMGVSDFSNASVCNKEKLSSFVMGQVGGGGTGVGTTFGTERTGSGNDTVIILVYLDTDGSTTGSCALTHNSSAAGYEFRLKYSTVWNATLSKAVETFNAYKCDNSDWKATDIKLSAWKKKMCS